MITILSLIQDITEQKKAEEALKVNELRYREFFDTAPEALFVLDAQTSHFVDYNTNALSLLKCNGDELLKRSPESISPVFQPDGERSKEKIEDYIAKTINGKRPIFELVVIDSIGKEIFCEFRLSLLTNTERPLIRASVLDITERVLLEKKLVEEELKKQMEITDAVIIAQERERSFLGEELHDNINQVLATSKLYMERAINSEVERKDLMTDSKNYIFTAMEEIRKLSKSLLPPSLGDITLLESITEMIGNMQKVNKINFIKEWEGVDENFINEKLSLAIFRILQEQINNIIKHASALNVIIKLNSNAAGVQLLIKDDGVGFDVSAKRNGIGLKNIISRAELLNGQVTIKSVPGNGCELFVNFKV